MNRGRADFVCAGVLGSVGTGCDGVTAGAGGDGGCELKEHRLQKYIP